MVKLLLILACFSLLAGCGPTHPAAGFIQPSSAPTVAPDGRITATVCFPVEVTK